MASTVCMWDVLFTKNSRVSVYELNLKWNGRFWRKKKQTDSIFSENSIDPTSEVKDNTNHLKIKCILTFYSTPPTSEK